MDLPQEHVADETVAAHGGDAPEQQAENQPQQDEAHDLSSDLKGAYQALSNSVWGSRIGGFFGQVKKQGESYYEGARQEFSAASAEASKGWTDLINHTQVLTPSGSTTGSATDSSATLKGDTGDGTSSESLANKPESLPADIVKEAETILSRFRVDAAERLKQIQKAEDAADAALERFGSNIKNFLRDAVIISPPVDEDTATAREVLFESKDLQGKRVVHATRFDAQLHAIHTNSPSFTKDPDTPEFPSWKEGFDVEKKTDEIAKYMDQYEELRTAMDKLVPETVSYVNFWTRYYFLRHVIETEEQKRRELLRGTQMEEEEVAWDDDDDDDEQRSGTPNASGATPKIQAQGPANEQRPSTDATASKDPAATDLLKPNEGRRSNEQSVADSDASYDMVSGATSRSPGTPKEEKDLSDKKVAAVKSDEESDEDWE